MLTAFLFTACADKPQKKQAKKKTPKKEMPAKKASASAEEVAPAEEEPTSPPMTPEQLQKAKDIIASVSAEDIAAVAAKKKFKMLCAACHGFTGNLKVNGAKDLTKSKITLEESVAQVYFGKGLMTPFKGIMTDAEIVAVAKYIAKELVK